MLFSVLLHYGLFSEREAARCHIMREIRNVFAHNNEANFLTSSGSADGKTAI
jgi:hypothetical protein